MNMKGVKQLGERLTSGSKPKSNGTHVDSSAIRELAELLEETGLTEIEIEQGGQRLRVSRQTAPVYHGAAPMAAAPAPAAAATPATAVSEAPKRDPANTVNSPMVGTVYVSPEPGKPAFVKVGDSVKEGATLLIVEAMKTMNPILAPKSGTVTEICVKDAQPIEFGQALLVIS
ncbi:MAG TPA: acetyl-CoA carboxylase biotin carboxyl carrier protein [Rhizomicrobium sp.]|jgi:acetyl-CoA carboxylase biotin carboxyl carrier protein|nr:acetyl-CoA carboxylase biotin carboxyl carrier protein [Rhizomicrobium sp.]